jgi:hypothetical protein
MNANLDCLSLMELLDVRTGGVDIEAHAHIDACPRCRALLATIPANLTLPQPADGPPARPADAARRPRSGSAGIRTGALWRATGEGDDIAWVVAVIGRAPGGSDRVMVAPVFGQPELATDQDLILEPSVLGYGAFVDMSNVGVLLGDQLVEPLNVLSGRTAQLLADLYRAVFAGEPVPDSEMVGPAVVDECDLRLLAADDRRQAVRALWRRADQLVDAEDASETDGATEGTTAGAAEETPEGPGVAAILDGHLIGASAEWDRPTLLEVSGADGFWLDAFSEDRLDLTDRRDVEHLARIFSTLGVDAHDAEPAIVCSLARSEGGLRQAEGPAMPMAARSQPGMSEDEVTESLYADQSAIDRSPQARKAAIAQYLADFRHALEDLD